MKPVELANAAVRRGAGLVIPDRLSAAARRRLRREVLRRRRLRAMAMRRANRRFEREFWGEER